MFSRYFFSKGKGISAVNVEIYLKMNKCVNSFIIGVSYSHYPMPHVENTTWYIKYR